MNKPEKSVFEIVAVWDGEIFAHTAGTLGEAYDWLDAYINQKNCKVRIWVNA